MQRARGLDVVAWAVTVTMGMGACRSPEEQRDTRSPPAATVVRPGEFGSGDKYLGRALIPGWQVSIIGTAKRDFAKLSSGRGEIATRSVGLESYFRDCDTYDDRSLAIDGGWGLWPVPSGCRA